MEGNMTGRIWRIGSLLSKDGLGTEAIMSACEKGLISGEVVLVVSDEAEAVGLEKARAHNVPTLVMNDGMVGQATSLFSNDFSKHRFSPEKMGELVGKSVDIIPDHITETNERAAWIIKRFLVENFLLDMLIRSKIDFLLLDDSAWKLSAFFIEQIESQIGRQYLVNIS